MTFLTLRVWLAKVTGNFYIQAFNNPLFPADGSCEVARYAVRPEPEFYPHTYGAHFRDQSAIVDFTTEGSQFTHRQHVSHHQTFYRSWITRTAWMLESTRWVESLLVTERVRELAGAYHLDAEQLFLELFDIWNATRRPAVALVALFKSGGIGSTKPWPTVSTMLQRYLLTHGYVCPWAS
jgi:hypothetical protein